MQRQGGWIETDSDLDWDLHWADVGWIRENLDAVTPLQDHQVSEDLASGRGGWDSLLCVLLVAADQPLPEPLRAHAQGLAGQEPQAHQEAARAQVRLCGGAESRREAELYDFWAATFVLPHEYGMFLEEFKRTPGGRWIMKPVGKAQGRGIFLFEKLSDISEWKRDASWKGDGAMQAKTADTYIVQKYVESPYLLGGKKFDLRLYVLVTSCSPLTFWIYRAGFARFSHTRYSQSKGDMGNLFMHLTNASVQKGADDYDERLGCKWPLHSLKMFLISKHGQEAVDRLFHSIQSLITRSLLAVQPTIIQDRHCFELYGYDVLIDSALKPWLIEVNASPSLTGDTDADYSLKANLVQHTLDIVDLERRREGNELHIGGFDLIWNNGSAVPNAKPNGYSSYLGCAFETMDAPERG
ncbi:hypothetical protein ON010_g17260 [Phytophthora cinnamomi]|nr:hypothetical protein ON010_g17260 [Phytophthora cinnamomi]